MYYKEIELNQKMDSETRKYLSAISKFPEEMLHLHDMVFPEGIIVENNQLPFEYESDSFKKQKPLPYEKDIIDVYSSKKYWWNDIDLEYKKELLWDAEERADNFLESDNNMSELTDKEFEETLRELDNILPPKVHDIENMNEYCKSIKSRLLNHPPIPLDMLLLHDAVFMEGEFVSGSDIVKPSKDKWDETDNKDLEFFRDRD